MSSNREIPMSPAVPQPVLDNRHAAQANAEALAERRKQLVEARASESTAQAEDQRNEQQTLLSGGPLPSPVAVPRLLAQIADYEREIAARTSLAKDLDKQGMDLIEEYRPAWLDSLQADEERADAALDAASTEFLALLDTRDRARSARRWLESAHWQAPVRSDVSGRFRDRVKWYVYTPSRHNVPLINAMSRAVFDEEEQ